MFTIFRGGNVFAPEPLGCKDILVAGPRIAAVCEPGRIDWKGVSVKTLAADDLTLIPGFIDPHVHILGGGGEGGPATRAPEIRIENIFNSGVTTLIGCLGTDGITRHMESLLAKASALEIEGVTTYIFSGSYEIPVNTITGSIRSDLVLISKVIGAGEIAISDHRSSQPSFEEFAHLAAECRVGGMLGGKAGILHCHLGDGERRLELIFRLLENTEIPPTQVIPTHCNRNPELMAEAVRFIEQGGVIDLTAGADPALRTAGHLSIAEAVHYCRERRVSLDQITVSSDGNGSMPVFNEEGKLTGLTIADQSSLKANFAHLIRENIASISEAVRLFSTNSAFCYQFPQKGELKQGKDADLLAFDGDWRLVHAMAGGKITIEDGRLCARGTFTAVT